MTMLSKKLRRPGYELTVVSPRPGVFVAELWNSAGLKESGGQGVDIESAIRELEHSLIESTV